MCPHRLTRVTTSICLAVYWRFSSFFSLLSVCRWRALVTCSSTPDALAELPLAVAGFSLSPAAGADDDEYDAISSSMICTIFSPSGVLYIVTLLRANLSADV